MKRETILFNGGLQTKVAPHLAQPNQAVECSNLDLDKGSIYPYSSAVLKRDYTANGYYAYVDKSDNFITSFADEKRSYAEYGSRLYFTNGSYGSYGLYRVKDDLSTVDAVPPTVTSFGGITFNANIADGNLNAEYAYVYTVVDEEGIESIPSTPYSVVANNENVSISFGSDTVNETVIGRKLYRTGGSNPTFNLIAEIPVGTDTYIDSTRDIDVSRIELTSFDSYSPPVELEYLKEANGTLWGAVGERVYFSGNGRPEVWNPLDYVTLNRNCTGIGVYRDLVLAFTDNETYVISGFNRDNIVVDKLPYKEGCINHYSIANVTEFLVWTSDNGVCIFNGSTIEVVTKNLLSWHRDVKAGGATFDSLESSFDSNIGYNVTQAVGLDGKYYAIFQEGIGVFDLDKGLASTITDFVDVPAGIFYDRAENLVGIITENTSPTIDDLSFDTLDIEFDLDGGIEVYLIGSDSEDKMLGVWKTPEIFLSGYEIIKQFRKIEFDTSVESVTVFIDNKQIKQYNNKKKIFLPSGSFGYTISLRIETSKEVRSMKIEYGDNND
jgi:hypothetical protein